MRRKKERVLLSSRILAKRRFENSGGRVLDLIDVERIVSEEQKMLGGCDGGFDILSYNGDNVDVRKTVLLHTLLGIESELFRMGLKLDYVLPYEKMKGFIGV